MMSDIVDLTAAWLKHFAEAEFDQFPGRISEDFVLRLPFVPPGVPKEIRGRENVRDVLLETVKGRSRINFTEVKIMRTEDPELVVATANGEAQMANGNTYSNSYVFFTRIRGDEVIEHTEYLNPLQFMAAAGDPSGD
ncbi:MAG: nuclear transport factor 2 family protein [Novosphingobium sp.]|nr:nuclear transport factor 2 family protein [Novosphingobium sp.]